MLDEIESALYAEDPKFASSVTRHKVRLPNTRRRIVVALGFLAGLALLVGGLMVDVEIGGLKVLSFIGFLLMFGMAVYGLMGGRRSMSGPGAGSSSKKNKSGSAAGGHGSLSQRMEDRFNRRFEGDDRDL
ncbi:putative transmembrane protein [Gordonia neofelifaecis NRRL B-59395]|uniref:Putative transmembrane protein n=2 Tax=Gordonia TaxID=2053 RepID=F1YHL4_9ACTN|nr:putative transmembrane protein [Gordonia neofelifaecis NRRL B-59395]